MVSPVAIRGTQLQMTADKDNTAVESSALSAADSLILSAFIRVHLRFQILSSAIPSAAHNPTSHEFW